MIDEILSRPHYLSGAFLVTALRYFNGYYFWVVWVGFQLQENKKMHIKWVIPYLGAEDVSQVICFGVSNNYMFYNLYNHQKVSGFLFLVKEKEL